MRQLLFSSLLVFFIISCKKESSDNNYLGRLDITDANCLFYGTVTVNPQSKGDIADTLKLFKLTNANEVHPVTFYSSDETEMADTYITDGIFNLNETYFLLNVYLKGDENRKIETYIVNKYGGSSTQLVYPIIPAFHSQNGWTKGYPPEGFISPDSMTFYIPDGQKITRLQFSPAGNYSLLYLNTVINPITFIADSSGNCIANNFLFLSDNSQIQIPEVGTNDLLVNKTSSGFYKLSPITDSIKIEKIDVVYPGYIISSVKKLPVNLAQNKYLGNAYIENLKASCFVFDKSLIYIDSDTCHLVNFNQLSLKSIKNFYVTNFALYINGFNILNKEVFLKLNPQSVPASFTDIIAPDEYNYQNIQVCRNGGITFTGKKVYETGEVIGYRSASKSVSILDNEFGIKIKQVLTLK